MCNADRRILWAKVGGDTEGKKAPNIPEINRLEGMFSEEMGDSSWDIKRGESFLNWIELGRNMKY